MSTNLHRDAVRGLYERVLEAALGFLEKSPAPHAKIMDAYKVARNISDRALTASSLWGAHRFGAYVLAWEVCAPWYSDEDVMIEDILIKAYPEDCTRTLQEVLTEDIPELARTLGVRYVFTGDTQGLGYMGEQYTRAGFGTLGTMHCLEV
jgi:hypothetical protein